MLREKSMLPRCRLGDAVGRPIALESAAFERIRCYCRATSSSSMPGTVDPTRRFFSARLIGDGFAIVPSQVLLIASACFASGGYELLTLPRTIDSRLYSLSLFPSIFLSLSLSFLKKINIPRILHWRSHARSDLEFPRRGVEKARAGNRITRVRPHGSLSCSLSLHPSASFPRPPFSATPWPR